MTGDTLRRYFNDIGRAPERHRDRHRAMARDLERALAPFVRRRADVEMFATIEIDEDGKTRTRLPPELVIVARELDEHIEQIRQQFAKAAGLDANDLTPTR